MGKRSQFSISDFDGYRPHFMKIIIDDDKRKAQVKKINKLKSDFNYRIPKIRLK